MTETIRIRLVLPPPQLAVFASLLQRGVRLQAQVGCNVLNLLVGQFGIDRRYVEERITTLFVDSKAIDGLETTFVRDGSVLALSAAMPGLVGATMRRGGRLAAMRGGITYQAQTREAGGAGQVRIKLFNMVLSELGTLFLGRGVLLLAGEMTELLRERPESFWRNIADATWDGQRIEPLALQERVAQLPAADEVLLQVEFRD